MTTGGEHPELPFIVTVCCKIATDASAAGFCVQSSDFNSIFVRFLQRKLVFLFPGFVLEESHFSHLQNIFDKRCYLEIHFCHVCRVSWIEKYYFRHYFSDFSRSDFTSLARKK
jgi:hypothetical protein